LAIGFSRFTRLRREAALDALRELALCGRVGARLLVIGAAQRTAVLVLVIVLLPYQIISGEQSADLVVVYKSRRELLLFRDHNVIRKYKVALGRDPIGPKTGKGDGKTPEGHYVIDSRNAKSRFHLALHVSYPNADDRARARRQRINPGGDIMIHGLPPWAAVVGSAHTVRDWTNGCIAVSNAEIDEIWRLVPNGTRVQINP
jgi:murein L,D-transpeptidase YafK